MPYTTLLLQTIITVEGEGLNPSAPLNLAYTVPQGCTPGFRYLRAGNSSEGMVNVTLLKDGKVMRYFPISAGGAMHVPLSIVDELQPGTEITVSAAGEGAGTLILDIGVLEVNSSG